MMLVARGILTTLVYLAKEGLFVFDAKEFGEGAFL